MKYASKPTTSAILARSGLKPPGMTNSSGRLMRSRKRVVAFVATRFSFQGRDVPYPGRRRWAIVARSVGREAFGRMRTAARRRPPAPETLDRPNRKPVQSRELVRADSITPSAMRAEVARERRWSLAGAPEYSDVLRALGRFLDEVQAFGIEI